MLQDDLEVVHCVAVKIRQLLVLQQIYTGICWEFSFFQAGICWEFSFFQAGIKLWMPETISLSIVILAG